MLGSLRGGLLAPQEAAGFAKGADEEATKGSARHHQFTSACTDLDDESDKRAGEDSGYESRHGEFDPAVTVWMDVLAHRQFR